MSSLPNFQSDQQGASGKRSLKSFFGGRDKEKELDWKSEAYLEETEKAPELAPELEQVGVNHIKDEIELSPQDKGVGIEAAAQSTPLTAQPAGVANLSLTDDQIEKALHQKLADSILWLATWCLRQIQLIHRKIRRQK